MSKTKKTRISITMTQPYLDAMQVLIDEGIYLTKGEFVLEALRDRLKDYDLALFNMEYDK